jgi:hypothetical protein
LVLAAFGVLSACGPDNSLAGSLDALFPLTVSRVEIRRNEEAFQVAYFNNRGHELDLVAQLTVALADAGLTPGTKLDLAGEYAPGHRRAVVSHAPGGQAVRVMPDIIQGDLMLEAGGAPGEVSRGTFAVRFEEGSELGSGRTLDGRFSGLTLDAGFEPAVP